VVGDVAGVVGVVASVVEAAADVDEEVIGADRIYASSVAVAVKLLKMTVNVKPPATTAMELLQRGRVEPGWLIVVGLIHLQLRICSIDGHELSARPPTTGRGAPPWAVGSWSTRGWAWSNPCARARGAELLRQGRPWAWAE